MTSVPVLFSFARSGGTLVNQLLGTHPDCLVLSEVNPAACCKPLADQAVEWLHLIEPDEVDGFQQLTYVEQIRELRQRAAVRKRRLIVRDWSIVNFVPASSPNAVPSAVLEQALYLHLGGIRIVPLVIARRGAHAYLSCRRNFEQFENVDAQSFSRHYLQYAKAVERYPIVTLERVRDNPMHSVVDILRTFELSLDHVDLMLRQFSDFRHCTGNNTLRRQTESSMATSVLGQDATRNFPDCADLALQFKQADRLLGYD